MSRLADGRREPAAVLAIEQGTFGKLLGAVLGTFGIAFAGVGVAGAIVVVVLWQRSKARGQAGGGAGGGD